MDICKSIDVASALKGSNDTQLAKGIGISGSHLSVMKTRNNMTTKTLAKIAVWFDFKVSEFIALGET